MSDLRLSRESGCLVIFHLRSAALRFFLSDLVCSFSQGEGLNLGSLDRNGAMESRAVRQFLLKLSNMMLMSLLIVGISQGHSSGEVLRMLQKALAELSLKMRDLRGTVCLGGGRGRGALKTRAMWSVVPVTIKSSISSTVPRFKPIDNTMSKV